MAGPFPILAARAFVAAFAPAEAKHHFGIVSSKALRIGSEAL